IASNRARSSREAPVQLLQLHLEHHRLDRCMAGRLRPEPLLPRRWCRDDRVRVVGDDLPGHLRGTASWPPLNAAAGPPRTKATHTSARAFGTFRSGAFMSPERSAATPPGTCWGSTA